MASETTNPPPQDSDNINEDLDKITAKLKRLDPDAKPKPKKHISFFPPDLLQSRPSPPKSAPIATRPPPAHNIYNRPPPFGHNIVRNPSVVRNPNVVRAPNVNRGNNFTMSFR